jgi:transposase InsO family protein/predicted aspartyl protease
MNGFGIVLHSLADTGANGYLFLNRPLASRLSKAIGTPIQPLPHPTPVRGFADGIQARATHYIRLHLTIDGRRIYNCPFVILDLGSQDMIIGIKWMKRFKLEIDTARNRFRWPPEYPPTPSWAKEILIPYDSRKIFARYPQYQADAIRRDKQIDKDELRRQNRTVSVIAISELSPSPIVQPDPPVVIRSPPESPPKTHRAIKSYESPRIAMVSANAMYFYKKRKRNEFFVASLKEIEGVINELSASQDPFQEDPETEQLINKLLPPEYQEFKGAFSKSESNRLPPHRDYDHKIELESPLPSSYSPLYRQSTTELQVLKQYILENLDRGFIEPAGQVPFASPVLFVKKPDGSLRLCVDYRKLNALTRKDAYPIPRIDELLARVSKAKVFTKLDVQKAFNRVRMAPDSEEYTAFRTRYGTYKSKVLPFGLCNGPATYQRYMNDVLMEYLDEFCLAYLDDILIYSENLEEHEEHVKKVLTRLREAGLQADIRKSEFSVQRTKYLGLILTTKGLEVDPDKVAPLKNWRRPTTVTGVKSYLGFCGFYRQFIRNFGKIAKPLSTITRPTEPFVWTSECEEAFEELRRQLLDIQATYHFNPELPTKLETDASDGVTAGVLSQQHANQQWYPIGFYSHVLAGAEINWEIHDKELSAIVQAFEKWRPELMSCRSRVGVYSDHHSLEYFMSTKLLTAKQVRWMEFLSDFNFEIKYTAAKNNQKADILSRREQDLASQELVKKDSRSRVLLGPAKIDPRISAELAQTFIETKLASISSLETEYSPETLREPVDLTEELKQVNKDSFSSIRAKLPPGYSIADGLLLYQGRLLVERNTPLCTKLITEAHTQKSSAHPGGTKTYQLLAPKYYWVGMGSDCKRFVANCIACKYAHTNQSRQQGLLHPLPIPDYPMQHLCMDFKEFPKDRNGYDCILVFIDRLSKAAVTIPCHKTVDARKTAQLFIQWIYRFGHTPESIISDRGPQFISSFWQEFCRIIGVKIKLSTAYHKQTDGQTEIINRYIDQRLRPFVNYYQDNWSELIPMMDRAQMTLPHSSIGMTPYQLRYGTEPRNSWDWNTPKTANPREKLNQQEAIQVATRMYDAWKLAKENLEKAQERMQSSVNQHRRAIDWKVGDQVYLSTKNLKVDQPSRKLASQWKGPFRILEKVGFAYRLKLPEGSKIHDVFSPDVLLKDPETPLVGQENPKPSGEIIQGEEEWEVDHIVAAKLFRKTLKYQASWVGHDPDPTWYPASNFMRSPFKLRDFHTRFPNAPGPPRNLPEWIQAWETGEEDTDHLIDNRPASPTDTNGKKETT